MSDVVSWHPGSVALSAHTGDGVELFLRTLSDRLRSVSKVIELFFPMTGVMLWLQCTVKEKLFPPRMKLTGFGCEPVWPTPQVGV